MSTENNEEGEEEFLNEEDQEQQGEQQEQQDEPKPKSAEEELRSAAEALRQMAAPKQEEPKAPERTEMTAEEKEQFYAIYNPKKTKADFMKKFFRLNPDATPEEEEEAEHLFADMQNGLVRQAVTTAKRLYDEDLRKMREEYEPVREYVSQQKAESFRKRFFDTYPDLNDPRYADVITASAQVLSTDKSTPQDESGYFKALAERAAKTISGVNPEFKLGATQTKKPTKPTGTTSRLPRTSVGGTGGTSGGQARKPVAAGKIDENDPFDFGVSVQ